jgi:mRNA-degrading endonuclease RelE of RelBE toxin-antitoxin system
MDAMGPHSTAQARLVCIAAKYLPASISESATAFHSVTGKVQLHQEIGVPFSVRIVPSALDELKGIKAFIRRRIAQAIDEQLVHQPTIPTRNRKPLSVTEASFDFDPPLWELRVGDFRVFYDVDEEQQAVYIRAVREKPPHATCEEAL